MLTFYTYFSLSLSLSLSLFPSLSPTLELKVTPASRKRVSTRNKRSSAISLSTLYQDEEEDKSAMRFPASDEDPDFLPSNTTPFKARKKQKRY